MLRSGTDVCRAGPDVLRSRCRTELLCSGFELLRREKLLPPPAVLQAQVLQSAKLLPQPFQLLPQPFQLLRPRTQLLRSGSDVRRPDVRRSDLRRSDGRLLPVVST